MKGGIFSLLIIAPLTNPMNVPAARPMRSTRPTGQGCPPEYSLSMASALCRRLATVTATKATTAPEDRSIPAVMMHIVTPRAMIPITLIWRSTFSRLLIRRKRPPERMAITMDRPTKMRRMLYLLMNARTGDSRLVVPFSASITACLHGHGTPWHFAAATVPCTVVRAVSWHYFALSSSGLP